MIKHPMVLAFALAALPLAACSSGTSTSAATPTATQTQTATATATQTATATATHTATQTATAAASATSTVTQAPAAAVTNGGAAQGCLAKNLEVTYADDQAGQAGSSRYKLTVKNIGDAACTLKDPKVTWVSGPEYVEQVGSAGEYSSGQGEQVTVQPGTAAMTHVYVGFVKEPNCQEKSAFALGLWAADGKAAVAPFKHTVCDGSAHPDLGVDHFQLA